MHLFIAILLQLSGFYLLYSTSKRAVFVKNVFQQFLMQYKLFSTSTGCTMILISLFLFMYTIGYGVGIVFFLTTLMAVSGSMILLLPLKK